MTLTLILSLRENSRIEKWKGILKMFEDLSKHPSNIAESAVEYLKSVEVSGHHVEI
jgi:hypothetical protein